MQASETKLRKLIEGTHQYLVPLFQRPYSWSEKHWKTLWTDLRDKADDDDDRRPHFFGSIVAGPAKSVPQSVAKYLIIDGQQRLTTTQLFLAALRDSAAHRGQASLAKRIQDQYLTNPWENGDEKYKLIPTHVDRAAFRAIVESTDVPESRLRECWRFFISKLDRLSPDELERLHHGIMDRFSLVSITCDEQDNPQLIFESLNAKGEKLTPADLIRNYIFMRVGTKDQDILYERYWQPIQDAVGDDLTEFVRHYLMKEGKILNKSDVYFELKERLADRNPADAAAFLHDLHRHGLMYSQFRHPNRCKDPEIAAGLERIQRLEVTVAFPLLLRVFDALESKQIDSSQVVRTLEFIESFIIRRMVCAKPSNQLRKIFPPAFDASGGASKQFPDNLRREFGGDRCPDDSAFARELESAALYATDRKNSRLRLILERLERSHPHKEPADLASATIEHVLPQSPTEVWRKELGESFEDWESVVHSLGNLTLTGYNLELSNLPFSEKKHEFAQSNIQLNRYFADVERWTIDAIRQRGRHLARIALEIWPDVGRTSSRSKKSVERPRAVRFRGETSLCKTWADGYEQLIRHFDAASPDFVVRVEKDARLSSIVSPSSTRFIRSQFGLKHLYFNKHASAENLQDWLQRIAEAGGIRPEDYEFIHAKAADR